MPRTDDHHDERYEDGEPLPVTDWNFEPAPPPPPDQVTPAL